MTTAIIPAAGESLRLGQPKQLVQLNGETLVHRAARACLAAGCARVLVVEGAVPLRAAVEDLPVEVVSFSGWRQGLGASLRAGAQAAGEVSVLVLLVDQHRITPTHLRALMRATGEVAAAEYGGALGVPARFSVKQSQVLRELRDDQGARDWLRAHAAEVTAVPMPEAEVDLDAPGDLAALK